METLKLIFQLGVLFSAFAFVWFWVKLLIILLAPPNYRNNIRYFLQLMYSLFLGTLVLKFFLTDEPISEQLDFLLLSLLIYFLYLIRNIGSPQRKFMFQMNNQVIEQLKTKAEWEWTVAILSLMVTVVWVFYPVPLDSRATVWYYERTNDVIAFPVIGWFFKIAGIFFVIATILRFMAGLTYLFARSGNHR